MLLENDINRLHHMFDSAKEITVLTAQKNRESVLNDRVLVLALLRLLEVIGEAASRIELESRKEFPNIPWKQIIGLRNRLIHGYDSVDMDILWKIISEEIPQLVDRLATIGSS